MSIETSPTSSAVTARPRLSVPILASVLLGIVIGFGLGRFQSSLTLQALQEKLDTSENYRKIAVEATGNVEKQSARLLGRGYLNIAVDRLNRGDEKAARSAVTMAEKAFQRGETETSQELTKQTQGLLQGSLQGKQAEIQAIGAKFDSSLPLATSEAGGAR